MPLGMTGLFSVAGFCCILHVPLQAQDGRHHRVFSEVGGAGSTSEPHFDKCGTSRQIGE